MTYPRAYYAAAARRYRMRLRAGVPPRPYHRTMRQRESVKSMQDTR